MAYYHVQRKLIGPGIGEIPVGSIVETDKDTAARLGSALKPRSKPGKKEELDVIEIKPEEAPAGDKVIDNLQAHDKTFARKKG